MNNSSKTAIVVIHGMGNQYPMQTITSFVENFFHKKVYSSPERVTGSYDQRKLICYDDHNNRYDCFEFYWAHLIEEPSLNNTISWIYSLLYCKKSSERFKIYKLILQFAIPILLSIIIWLFYYYYKIFILLFFSYPALMQILIMTLPIVLYFLLKKISHELMSSFGDVIRYTVPHPSNIATRQKISNAAVDFLTKLHDKNEFGYDRIVIVGHSLGSIIAYDMIVNTFGHFNKMFENKSGITKEEAEFINKLNTPNQRRMVLGNDFMWRVTDFITCGSPLCHVKMIMVKDEIMFDKKVQNGEYPISPPNRDNLFYELNEHLGSLVPTHDSIFGFVNWTNIFFKNDAIGGYLKNIFGTAIDDTKITPKTYGGIKISHSQYWNAKEEKESFEKLRQVIMCDK